jgi:hydrogenase-4 component B
VILYLFVFLSLIPFFAWPFGNRVLYAVSAIDYSAMASVSFYLMLADYSGNVFMGKYIAIGADPLSLIFLVILSVVWALASFYSVEYDRNSRINSLFFTLAIFSMFVIIISRSYPVFIFAWEGMTISGYFLIGYRKGVSNIPPYVFLVYGELSSLLIVVMFAGMYSQTGSMMFTRADYSEIILFLGVMGFFIKMGLMPFQITEWLPIAHGNAPTNGSILFSATMTTAAVYSIVRFLTLSVSGQVFGDLLMAIGGFSLLFASIYSASAEHVKMLPAYSTIENGGAMLILIGSYIDLVAIGNYNIATFAFLALIVYAFAHAVAKGGLFMFAGIMEKGTNNSEIKSFSGFERSRSYTAGGLAESISLSGLLPTGGGVGEWMLLETLFIMVTLGYPAISVVATIVGATAALGGGISLIAMTKIFGFGSRGGSSSQRSGAMTGAVLLAGTFVLGIGVFASFLILGLSNVSTEMTGVGSSFVISSLLIVPKGFLILSPGLSGDFGLVSPFFVAFFIAIFSGLMLVIGTGFRKRRVQVWNGGLEKTADFHSFAYANSLRLTMRKFYFTKEEVEGRNYSERTFDVFWITILFLARSTVSFSRRMGYRIMNSSIASYILYIMIAFSLVMIYVSI